MSTPQNTDKLLINRGGVSYSILYQDINADAAQALTDAASAQTTADAALPKAGGTLTGPLTSTNSATFSGTVTAGNYVGSDGVPTGVPTGAVFHFVSTAVPSGYLKCNGDTIPNGSGTVQGITADFSALFALVGSVLPDLRGEFIRGLDDGRGVDSGRGINTQGDQNKQHTHTSSASLQLSILTIT